MTADTEIQYFSLFYLYYYSYKNKNNYYPIKNRPSLVFNNKIEKK